MSTAQDFFNISGAALNISRPTSTMTKNKLVQSPKSTNQNKLKIDICNFEEPQFENSRYILTSPRSLASCSKLKIKPSELLSRTLQEFTEELVPLGIPLSVVYAEHDDYEAERQRKISAVKSERQALINGSTPNKQTDAKRSVHIDDSSPQTRTFSREMDRSDDQRGVLSTITQNSNILHTKGDDLDALFGKTDSTKGVDKKTKSAAISLSTPYDILEHKPSSEMSKESRERYRTALATSGAPSIGAATKLSHRAQHAMSNFAADENYSVPYFTAKDETNKDSSTDAVLDRIFGDYGPMAVKEGRAKAATSKEKKRFADKQHKILSDEVERKKIADEIARRLVAEKLAEMELKVTGSSTGLSGGPHRKLNTTSKRRTSDKSRAKKSRNVAISSLGFPGTLRRADFAVAGSTLPARPRSMYARPQLSDRSIRSTASSTRRSSYLRYPRRSMSTEDMSQPRRYHSVKSRSTRPSDRSSFASIPVDIIDPELKKLRQFHDTDKMSLRDQKIIKNMLYRAEDERRLAEERREAELRWDDQRRREERAREVGERERRRLLAEQAALERSSREQRRQSIDSFHRRVQSDMASQVEAGMQRWQRSTEQLHSRKASELQERAREASRRQASQERALRAQSASLEREQSDYLREREERRARAAERRLAKQHNEVIKHREETLRQERAQQLRHNEVLRAEEENRKHLLNSIEAKHEVAAKNLDERLSRRDLHLSMNSREFDQRLKNTRRSQSAMDQSLHQWQNDLVQYRNMADERVNEIKGKSILDTTLRNRLDREHKAHIQRENLRRIEAESEMLRRSYESDLIKKEMRAERVNRERQLSAQQSRAIAGVAEKLRSEVKQRYETFDKKVVNAELQQRVGAGPRTAFTNQSSLIIG